MKRMNGHALLRILDNLPRIPDGRYLCRLNGVERILVFGMHKHWAGWIDEKNGRFVRLEEVESWTPVPEGIE